jgi:hypothetical protein
MSTIENRYWPRPAPESARDRARSPCRDIRCRHLRHKLISADKLGCERRRSP